MADKIVAFICTHNACRSQIAEALAKHAGYKGYAFYSAGSVPQKSDRSDTGTFETNI